MRKILKVLVISMMLAMSLSVVSFADSPSTQLRDTLKTIGVPSQYRDRVVSYLQSVKISKNQAKELEKYVELAHQTIGKEGNLSNLSQNQKIKLQKIAVDAGKLVGLKVKISNLSNNKLNTIEIYSGKGLIVSLTTKDVMNFITNFDINVLYDLVKQSYDFSNHINKDDVSLEYNPSVGVLNQTGLPYGNAMVMGSSMIGMAGGVYFISRKRF